MALIRQAAPLRVQAVKHLRSMIISGQYAPGMRLTERVLEEELGVSRTVVREALRQLESESLVSMESAVGPTVRALSYDEVGHLYEVRSALESTAGRLAAERATPEQLSNLVRLFKDLRTAAPLASADEIMRLKSRFYDSLIEASGNPIIGDLLANVQARISQLRVLTLSAPGRTAHMLAELERVVTAVAACNPDQAEAACRAHVVAAGKIALRNAALLLSAQSGERTTPEPSQKEQT